MNESAVYDFVYMHGDLGIHWDRLMVDALCPVFIKPPSSILWPVCCLIQ